MSGTACPRGPVSSLRRTVAVQRELTHTHTQCGTVASSATKLVACSSSLIPLKRRRFRRAANSLIHLLLASHMNSQHSPAAARDEHFSRSFPHRRRTAATSPAAATGKLAHQTININHQQAIQRETLHSDERRKFDCRSRRHVSQNQRVIHC